MSAPLPTRHPPPPPPPPTLTPNQTAILRPDRSKEQVRHSRMTFCSRAKQSNGTNWELQKGCVNFVTLAPEGRTEGGRRSDATQGTFPASCSAPPHSGAWCDITSPSVTFRTPRRERRTVARVDSKYSLLLHVLSVRAGRGGGVSSSSSYVIGTLNSRNCLAEFLLFARALIARNRGVSLWSPSEVVVNRHQSVSARRLCGTMAARCSHCRLIPSILQSRQNLCESVIARALIARKCVHDNQNHHQ